MMIVLQAYSGATRVFEVFRDLTKPAAPVTGRCVSLGSESDAPAPADELKIDRIVFFEQPDSESEPEKNVPILELPFVPGSVRVRLKGIPSKDRRCLIEQAFVRCFLTNHVPILPALSEVALFTAELTPENPTSANYTPLIFPRQKLRWHNADSSSNKAALKLQRSKLKDLRTGFFFRFDFLAWQIELGEVFDLTQLPHGGTLTVRAFTLDDNAPLQVEFALEIKRVQNYDFGQCGLPGVALRAKKLHWRQRPYGPVGHWPERPGGGSEPAWRVEMSLPLKKKPRAAACQALLDFYNASIATPVLHALRRVREGQPLSLLPHLTVDAPNDGTPHHNFKRDEWLLDIVIRGEWTVLRPTPGGSHSDALHFPKDFIGAGATFRIEFGTLQPGWLPDWKKPGEIKLPPAKDGLLLAATFRGFATVAGADAPVALAMPLLLTAAPLDDRGPPQDPHRKAVRPDGGLQVAWGLIPVRTEMDGDCFGQRVRLGALELAFGTPRVPKPTDPEPVLPPTEQQTRLALRFSLREDRLAGAAPVAELSMFLPVFRVGPAGQDALPGEEFAELFQSNPRGDEEAEYETYFHREAPLVLEVAPQTGDKNITMAPYGVAIVETVLNGKSQTVDLRLSQPDPTVGNPQGAAQRLWVIDRDPLLIAEVRFENALEALLAGTTNEIANFSTRSGAAWEMSAGARGFDLVLPPQGVGEAMEKNKATEDDRPPDIDKGKIIAYRFTPPAVLRVQPSYFRQRFAEPPWNLRRLLGYPGQRDPGMRVEEIHLELFYGLAGRVVSDELRLAEISARLGAVPGRQPRTPLWPATKAQREAYSEHRLAWAQWYALLLGRLAILEPWAPRQRDRELALTDGVSYRLRKSARLAFPTPVPMIDDGHGKQVPDWPRVQTLAPDVPIRTYFPENELPNAVGLPEAELAALIQAVADEAPGAPLPGGVSWPFESINLYNLLWAKPEAESGELRRPYFSALGGWGFQKAVFADGQLRIYADTAMGRTHSVTLEIFGRISVGWHLAKLVIIYERTVLPTRQFVHEDDRKPPQETGEQDALRGRPVMRKVREYVEILEPLRLFPDGAAAPVENGCVLGIEFPEGARQINVTSRWGEDVGVPLSPADQAEGWKVPLWLRGARPEDVYPKPQVVALCSAAQTDAPVRVEIDEPEKLFFFTNTKQGRARDPHLWPAVQGIDFTFVPKDAAKAPEAPEDWKKGDTEAAGADDRAVRGGLGPFTFALKPASHAIDVMAARAAQPTGALLRNVTLMRGFVEKELDANQTTFVETRDRVNAGVAAAREWFGETREALRGGTAPAEVVLGKMRTQMEKLHGDWTALAGTNGEKLPAAEHLCPRLRKQVLQALVPARVAGRALGENFASEALVRFEQIKAKPDAIVQDVKDALKSAGDAVLARWQKELLRLNPLLDEAQRARGALLGNADELGRGAGAWLEEFDRAVAALPAAWAAAAEVWETALEPWREARASVRSALTGLDDAVLQAIRPWIGALPHAFRFELRPLIEDLEEVLQKIELFPGLGAMEKAFANDSQTEFEAAVVQLRGEIHAQIANLDSGWAKLRGLGEYQLDKILHYAENVGDALAKGAKVEWEKIQENIDLAFPDPTAKIDETVGNALRREIRELQRTWETALDQVDAAVGNALDQANQLCETIFGAADKYLKYLEWLVGEDRIKQWLDDATMLLPTGEEIQRRLRALERELADAARGFVERAGAAAEEKLKEIAAPAVAAGDAVLRLVRAFGEAPRVPGLGFELPDVEGELAHIGYYFQDLAKKMPLPRVDLTPVLAKANQLGKDVLNALQITLPTKSLFDRFQPFELPNFDLRKIFPNFAGLNLADLFEGLKLPQGANDNVKITHGEDPQSLSGWVQIDVDQRFAQTATLFSFAGLTMAVRGGQFRATSRIEGGVHQGARQSFQGQITGDWAVTVGGFQLVVIERTALRFDDAGRITFDVRPERVKLPGPMAWLADLISKFNFGDKGFTFKVSPEGVQVVLNLPLPDVQAGAFGLANLSLGFFFELAILPEFVITTGARIASREAPFTLTIFILGGAGWFEFQLRYAPGSRELVATVSIGILASASLAISLGPISGGVYAYFGIVVDYTARRGAAGQLAVALVLRFSGRVSLLGIVTVWLEIGLAAQYSTGGGLIGRGYVSVKIKICWCFTLRVRCSVTYKFGGSGGGGQRALDASESARTMTHQQAADEYVAMFA